MARLRVRRCRALDTKLDHGPMSSRAIWGACIYWPRSMDLTGSIQSWKRREMSDAATWSRSRREEEHGGS
jgi:hypothetical protein